MNFKPEFKKFLFDYNEDVMVLAVTDSYAKARSVETLLDKLYYEIKARKSDEELVK